MTWALEWTYERLSIEFLGILFTFYILSETQMLRNYNYHVFFSDYSLPFSQIGPRGPIHSFYFVSEAPKLKIFFFIFAFYSYKGALLKFSDLSRFDHVSSQNG